MGEKLHVFDRHTHSSKRVAGTWNMMKEVVVQDHTEPMRTLRKCGI
jgi:hypothetical protein